MGSTTKTRRMAHKRALNQTAGGDGGLRRSCVRENSTEKADEATATGTVVATRGTGRVSRAQSNAHKSTAHTGRAMHSSTTANGRCYALRQLRRQKHGQRAKTTLYNHGSKREYRSHDIAPICVHWSLSPIVNGEQIFRRVAIPRREHVADGGTASAEACPRGSNAMHAKCFRFKDDLIAHLC